MNANDVFNNYFGENKSKDDYIVSPKRDMVEVISSKYEVNTLKEMADDNIDDIEQLTRILRRLANAAWGSNWGTMVAGNILGTESNKLILPYITIDINDREVCDSLPSLKPKLTEVVKETVDGKETGDVFLVYRQWFDCTIELNIYGRTQLEARQLQKKLEQLIAVYTGYLKRQGISELLFSKEIPGNLSLNYIGGIPMRADMYYARLESISVIRQSVLNVINLEIGLSPVSTETLEQALQKPGDASKGIELDFFPEYTGVKNYNI